VIGPFTGQMRPLEDVPFPLEPLELSGKLRGVLLQYHPRFTKTAAAKAELALAPERLAPLVPLVEFRHRSWMDEDERADTLAFLERHDLAYVSLDSPRTRASNVSPRVAAATHRVAYVRFHGRNAETWNLRGSSAAERFDWLYTEKDLAEWVAPLARLADEVTVKRWRRRGHLVQLEAENPDFEPIEVDLRSEPLVIEGVAAGEDAVADARRGCLSRRARA